MVVETTINFDLIVKTNSTCEPCVLCSFDVMMRLAAAKRDCAVMAEYAAVPRYP